MSATAVRDVGSWSHQFIVARLALRTDPAFGGLAAEDAACSPPFGRGRFRTVGRHAGDMTAPGRSASPARAAPVNPWPARLAATWSGLATVVGLWWLAVPTAYPFGAGDRHADMSLLAGTTAGQAAVLLLTGGPIGVVLAVAARAQAGPAVVAGAAAYAVGFGLLVPDLQLLILFTYLVTMLGPVSLVVLLAVGTVRSRRRVVVVVALAAVGISVWWIGGVGAGDMATALLDTAAALGTRPLVVGFFLAGGLLWAWTAVVTRRVGAARCGWCGRDGAAWTTPESAARWGRWVTIAAAIGPLPYGLSRMTWLLPEGLRFAPDSVDTEPGLRLFGLLIGLAAIGGSLLTLGLIAHWGEVWPRWLPVLHGRPVAPRIPVAFAATVAVLVTSSGISMIRQEIFANDGDWMAVLGMPLLVWGPLLGAAAFAYHVRRRTRCRRCGRA